MQHVFWSDRENIALPGSSTTAATSFVIQGELINISDDEVDDSPTAKVALTTFKKGKVTPSHNCICDLMTVKNPLTTQIPWDQLRSGPGTQTSSTDRKRTLP